MNDIAQKEPIYASYIILLFVNCSLLIFTAALFDLFPYFLIFDIVTKNATLNNNKKEQYEEILKK